MGKMSDIDIMMKEGLTYDQAVERVKKENRGVIGMNEEMLKILALAIIEQQEKGQICPSTMSSIKKIAGVD